VNCSVEKFPDKFHQVVVGGFDFPVNPFDIDSVLIGSANLDNWELSCCSDLESMIVKLEVNYFEK
jgi:hypothetical protein